MSDSSTPTWQTIEKMEREELLRTGEVLVMQIQGIKAQLTEVTRKARDTGEYADSGWFRRAENVRAEKGRANGHINHRLAHLRRLEKAANIEKHQAADRVWERAFIIQARERLSHEKYQEIVEATKVQIEVG